MWGRGSGAVDVPAGAGGGASRVPGLRERVTTFLPGQQTRRGRSCELILAVTPQQAAGSAVPERLWGGGGEGTPGWEKG